MPSISRPITVPMAEDTGPSALRGMPRKMSSRAARYPERSITAIPTKWNTYLVMFLNLTEHLTRLAAVKAYLPDWIDHIKCGCRAASQDRLDLPANHDQHRRIETLLGRLHPIILLGVSDAIRAGGHYRTTPLRTPRPAPDTSHDPGDLPAQPAAQQGQAPASLSAALRPARARSRR